MAQNIKLNFQIPSKARTWSMAFMGIGAVATLLGWMADKTEHHQYWWANLLINGFFFFGLAVAALFFYALQYAAEVAWSSLVKRVFEAMFSYIWVGIAIIGLVLIAGQAHLHHLYHWMDHNVMDPNHPDFDKIIAGKQPYLSPWFFWLRYVVYAAVFIGFAVFFRRWSLQEDAQPSEDLHKKVYRRGALFLVFFAVFSSTMAWDWLMSIDTHWFSTMYGWYTFSGIWVTCMIFATLLVLWLKGQGYLEKVNTSHIHDLGKWMFAISMLWSYLWFCQYMLTWYSNIPEEVTYFKERYNHYMYGMWTVFFVNFAVPFYVLIARDAKRNPKFLWRAGIIIFLSHFFDLYMAVVPGSIHGHLEWGFGEHGHHIRFAGWFEIGMFIGFLGLFITIVLKALTKAAIIPVNHPYLNESENHSI